ncbi:hypothetical protein BDV98DRAFT_478886, partial [Pterulicium gracile]
LLHLPYYIRTMGPLWIYWCFVMERFCGYLKRSKKSQKYPFASLARRLHDVAQLNQIKLVYQLGDEL